jgi:hypothetical protein
MASGTEKSSFAVNPHTRREKPRPVASSTLAGAAALLSI